MSRKAKTKTGAVAPAVTAAPTAIVIPGTGRVAPERVAELREQVEALKLADEAARLETRIRHREYAANLVEGWGDYVSPLDSIRSEQDYFGGGGPAGMGPRVSRASDRTDGDNAPFFTTEQELAVIRGAGEWIAQADTTAIGAMEALASYCIGVNGQYDAAAKDGDGADSAANAAEAAVQEIIDEFLKRVKWLNKLDREQFRRWRRAGERFLRIVDMGGGYAKLEVWEPAWITEPINARAIEAHYGLPALNWKYGVATTPGDATEVWGYWGLRNGDPQRGEFIPATEMSHIKCNVDDNVKRGMSDFYPGQAWLEKAAKLLDRVLDGGAIQASIALVKKYAPHFRQSMIRSAAESLVEFDSPIPSYGTGSAGGASGVRNVPTERFYSGKIVDMQGVDVETGPMGQSNAPVYLEIVDAGVSKALRRWSMQRTMATGDANTDTYASALVAESPFTKFCESVQGEIQSDAEEILWRVVDIACIAGRLPYDPQQLRQLIDITCKLPDVAVRDKKEEHEIRLGQHQAGLLSLETWSEQVGLSYEQEQERGAQSQAMAMVEAKAQADAAAMAGNDGESNNERDGKSSKKTPSRKEVRESLETLTEASGADDMATRMELAAGVLWGDYFGEQPAVNDSANA